MIDNTIISDKKYMRLVRKQCKDANNMTDDDLVGEIAQYEHRIIHNIAIANINFDVKQGLSKDSLSSVGKSIQMSLDMRRSKIRCHLKATASSKTPHPDGSYKSNFDIIIANDPVIYHHLVADSLSKDLFFYGKNINGNKGVLQDYIEKAYDITPKGKSMLMNAIYDYLYTYKSHDYNPVAKYLLTVEKWDGKKRIGKFLHRFLGASDKGDIGHYNAVVFTAWAVGAVARAMAIKPVNMEIVPLLIGYQGIGKTTCIEALAGMSNSSHPFAFNDGRGFIGAPLPKLKADDPEVIRYLMHGWIFPLDELGGFTKTSLDAYKSFISTKVLHHRIMYTERVQAIINHAAFIGSTNSDDVLKDDTGDRRTFPIKCADKEHAKFIQQKSTSMTCHYIYQFWAEALHYYNEYENCVHQAHEKHDNTDNITVPWIISKSYINWCNTHIFPAFKEFDPIESQLRQYLNIEVPKDWKDWTNRKKSKWFHDYDDEINDAKDNDIDLTHITFVTEAELIMATTNKYATAMSLSHSNSGRKIGMAMRVICFTSKWHHTRKQINGVRERGWKRPMPHNSDTRPATHTKTDSTQSSSARPQYLQSMSTGKKGYLVGVMPYDPDIYVIVWDGDKKPSLDHLNDVEPAKEQPLPFGDLYDDKESSDDDKQNGDRSTGKVTENGSQERKEGNADKETSHHSQSQAIGKDM